MEEEELTVAQLGFCVPVDDLNNVGHRNPDYECWDGGQTGGRPSWLIPKGLPRLECGTCQGSPYQFILQIYAPVDTDDTDRAYHRSLYVFGCPKCKSIRILRGQLAQRNDYYPFDLELEVNLQAWKQHTVEEQETSHACAVCGIGTSRKCPKQGVFVCGRKHQLEHFRYLDEESSEPSFPSVFALRELVVEDEPPPTVESDDGGARQTMFPETVDADVDDDDSDQDLEQEDLNRMTGSRKSEKQSPTTQAFYDRLSSRTNVQEQVLRYARWQDDAVLWMHEKRRPSEKDIPPCPYCSGPRKFEFQIMPQLLHFLRQDETESNTPPKKESDADYEAFKKALEQTQSLLEEAPAETIPPELVDLQDRAVQRIQDQLFGQSTSQLDWGVVAVYTCLASCDKAVSDQSESDPLGLYQEEFAWRQPSLDEECD